MRTIRYFLALSIVVIVSCGDREQMLQTLEALEQQNRDYVPFTSDSTALALTDYFDSHGTANERMRAHYILGCAYRDIGEIPRALECYNDAAECADTIASDCDYKTLSRVYGQMADLYHIEQMPEMEMQATNHSVTYAWSAKDTLAALFYESTKYGVYYQQKRYEENTTYYTDSSTCVCDHDGCAGQEGGVQDLEAGRWPGDTCHAGG